MTGGELATGGIDVETACSANRGGCAAFFEKIAKFE